MNTNDGLRALIGDDIEKTLEDSRVEGKTLGKYRIGSEIGKGGMGTVYLAKDESLGRTVVIKVVSLPSREPEHRQMMVARFRREAQAACRVIHPNVAVTFAFDEVDGRHLLVMERIDGRTLRDAIMPDGKPRAMAPKKAVRDVIEILKGLEAIHAANIIHRDIKPGNIMLTHKDDQVKILDFGLGKASESFGDPALDMTLTQQGMPIGSPLYMSPEQTRSLPVTKSTDIYSVGVIMFQMLTGQAPFRSKSGDVVELYEKHRNAPIPPIVSPSGPVPPALDAVVRKAMAKASGDRYPSASAMRAALEAVDFDPRPRLTVKPAPKPRLRFLPLLGFAVLAALAVGFVLMMGKAPAPAERGSEAVVMTAPGGSVGSDKGIETGKADVGIQIPPPPPPAVATVAQGCALYDSTRTTEAIATLTRALEKSPDDAEGLYCLCGAYVRQLPDTRAEAQQACKASRARPVRDAAKTRKVDLWLRRIR